MLYGNKDPGHVAGMYPALYALPVLFDFGDNICVAGLSCVVLLCVLCVAVM